VATATTLRRFPTPPPLTLPPCAATRLQNPVRERPDCSARTMTVPLELRRASGPTIAIRRRAVAHFREARSGLGHRESGRTGRVGISYLRGRRRAGSLTLAGHRRHRFVRDPRVQRSQANPALCLAPSGISTTYFAAGPGRQCPDERTSMPSSSSRSSSPIACLASSGRRCCSSGTQYVARDLEELPPWTRRDQADLSRL